MAADLILHTARLRLRPLRAGDEAALFAVFGDPQVMRYWSTPPWADPGPALAMIEHDLAAEPDGDTLRLALVDGRGDELLGTCSLFARSRQSRRAEMGYALARRAWGRGLMHEALRALLDHGFGAWDLNRVEADIDPRNAASARTLQRLGFQPEGLLRERWIVGTEVTDTQFWGLLQRDWPPPTPRA
jgi:RimJ/RimL family protein N-acetyltransferase